MILKLQKVQILFSCNVVRNHCLLNVGLILVKTTFYAKAIHDYVSTRAELTVR
jgi:hypothetical protein